MIEENNNEVVKSGGEEEVILSSIEARIIGALMEKQLTTPDTYPLTLNSLMLACNQKTSREPVMDLQESALQQSLYDLQKRALVKFEYASRADKYDQRFTREYHLNDAEHAIFCIMLLRGPQTLNELLTRTRRMYSFSSPEELKALIDKLLCKTIPLLCRIAPLSGQREERYMHLFCGEPDLYEDSVVGQPLSTESSDELVARIEELEKQVAWLMEQKS